jgi:glycosyltransferase involved in cell wall biosynthesis
MKLSICILSYNRPKELIRALNSIRNQDLNDIEVLIFDDCSPRHAEIRHLLDKEFFDFQFYKLISSDVNLGYDRNLFRCFEVADSDYVLLLGDDDMLEFGAVENILKSIQKYDYHAAVLPYKPSNELAKSISISQDLVFRDFHYDKFFPTGDLIGSGDTIYHFILFSGLIFRRSSVLLHFDLLKDFFNSIYIQVIIGYSVSSKHGLYSLTGPGVVIGSDGENGFGNNESSIGQNDLSDRKSLFANLNYQRRLISSLEQLSKIDDNFRLDLFFNEWNIRHIKQILIFRLKSRELLLKYWKQYKSLTNKIGFLNIMIFICSLLLPKLVVKILLNMGEILVEKKRKLKLSYRK